MAYTHIDSCYNSEQQCDMSFKTLFFLSLLIFAGWTRAYAQDSEDLKPGPVIIRDGVEKYPLGLHLEILEDPGGELTIEDVASPEFDSRFAPSQVEVPNYGFTNSAYWVRLRLRNESPESERWLLELAHANMHFVDLYSPLPGGMVMRLRRPAPCDRPLRGIFSIQISYST